MCFGGRHAQCLITLIFHLLIPFIVLLQICSAVHLIELVVELIFLLHLPFQEKVLSGCIHHYLWWGLISRYIRLSNYLSWWTLWSYRSLWFYRSLWAWGISMSSRSRGTWGSLISWVSRISRWTRWSSSWWSWRSSSSGWTSSWGMSSIALGSITSRISIR